MAKIKMGARHYLYPQPAIVAGVMVDGKPNFMTIAWCGIMQATPPLIYVSIRKERYSFKGFKDKENGTFSVNVPSTKDAPSADYCGLNSGHNIDKSTIFKTFTGVLNTAPMIENYPVNMECKLVKAIDFEGTHVVFVGEIIESYVNEECLVDGQPDPVEVDPLIFSTDGKYWGLGDLVGNAYEIGNKFTPKDS